MTITDLRIYPIKSLGGISVSEATVEEKGFQYDRRYMLVSPNGQFITQRANHQMALIEVAIADVSNQSGQGKWLRVWHRNHPDDVLELPLTISAASSVPTDHNYLPVDIWDSKEVPAITVSPEADRWFSKVLNEPCRLVFMPEVTRRDVDAKYAQPDSQGRLPAVSFADGYPYLLIGQASLDELNQRLPAGSPSMEMGRFRPNIVVEGSSPYEEDTWSHFRVGGMDFYGVKPCARCVLTTIDPATGQKGKEPLQTLATYRRWNHKILFGQNVLPDPTAVGVLRVGQKLEVLNRQEPWLDAPNLPLQSR
ncbi:MOSC domain-containing protein [Spirosoma soli]|uniref:MOSC domain-containing protein n=1 Tax=Spirosoma soli TaxID=1770529 RepID=A0ABW5MAJ4_9BACT